MVLKMNLENVQEVLPEWKSESGRECEQFVATILKQAEKLSELIRTRKELLSAGGLSE
jgi:hypothetical protein